MTVTQSELRDRLQSQFRVICFEDLGALVSRSISELYKCLKNHRREKYLAEDRLIFYSKNSVGDEILQHLDHGLRMFDIEPFFVLCCVTRLGHEPTTIAVQPTTVADAVDWDGRAPKLSSLCPMPWTSIQITNQGKFRPCCVYQGDIADIKDTTIHDAFRSQGYQEIREQLLNGMIPAGCTHCFQDEAHNQISNRQRSMVTFQQEFLLQTIQNPTIKNIDIRGGITCNMKCRICDEYSSSLWSAEKKQHSILSIESSDWIKQQDKFEQILSLLPQCTNIDFFGGEPLLNKQILTLFEIAEQQDLAKNIRLNMNTNGSVWNPKFIDHWKSFRAVNVGISIDDVGQRFELQRGSSWSTVQENVQRFVAMNDEKFKAYVYTTVNIQNVYYLPELFDWAERLGVEVTLSILNDPAWLSIDHMTTAAKHLVVDRLVQQDDARLKNLAQRISCSQGSNGEKFLAYMRDLDQKRQQNFSASHQEIAHAMGYPVQ